MSCTQRISVRIAGCCYVNPTPYPPISSPSFLQSCLNLSSLLPRNNAGGSPKYPQIKAIQSGVQVVIATPGRLNDIMEMGKINMTNVMTLALDEADRMLDMGFEPQIRTIIDAMPAKRQTLFFTATWPKEVQRLARDFVKNPVHITVGDAGKLNANKSITQHIHVSSVLPFVSRI